MGEEEVAPKDKVQWDGHSSSASAIHYQAKSGVTVQEQIEHIKKTQGLLVDENLEKIGPKVSCLES